MKKIKGYCDLWDIGNLDNNTYNLLLCPGHVYLSCTINSFNCYVFPLLGREDLELSYFYQGE